MAGLRQCCCCVDIAVTQSVRLSGVGRRRGVVQKPAHRLVTSKFMCFTLAELGEACRLMWDHHRRAWSWEWRAQSVEHRGMLSWVVLAAELFQEGLSAQEGVGDGLVVVAEVLREVLGRLQLAQLHHGQDVGVAVALDGLHARELERLLVVLEALAVAIGHVARHDERYLARFFPPLLGVHPAACLHSMLTLLLLLSVPLDQPAQAHLLLHQLSKLVELGLDPAVLILVSTLSVGHHLAHLVPAPLGHVHRLAPRGRPAEGLRVRVARPC